MIPLVVTVVATLGLCQWDPAHLSPIRLHRAVWILVNRRRPR